jgi:hypothetical protein
VPDFLKTNVDFSKNFIRGAARLMIADLTTPFPTVLNDMVRTAVTAQNEVQTITITGTPTGGTFNLTFKGYTTPAIPYNANAAAVLAALVALSSIGTGGVAVGGGPGPGTPYVVTFQNQLGGQNQPMITASGAGFTGGTTPAIAVVETTPGFGQWDGQAAWTDLGATKGGIRILRNNAEEAFDVDQIQAEIASQPTSWEMNVSSQVAQADIDMIQYLWEGGTITLDATTGERTLPLGTPTFYKQKRLAVGFQRPSTDGGATPGGVRFYCFRMTQRSPQESAFTHQKTGEQITVPFQWRCIADSTVPDQYARFGGIIDQK